MLYILSCVATRTKGLIFRTVECESSVDLTMADDKAEAMERLRAQAEARYGVDVKKRNAWKVELHVAEVPELALKLLLGEGAQVARRMAEAKAAADVDDDAASADATKESTDGQEEPVEAGKQEGGIDAQPEA